MNAQSVEKAVFIPLISFCLYSIVFLLIKLFFSKKSLEEKGGGKKFGKTLRTNTTVS